MAPHTATQRSQIQQFCSFTQAKESIAAKFLKQHGWNVETAVDAFYQSNNGNSSTASTSQSQVTLSKLFDNYRDEPKSSPNKIGIEGAQSYLSALKVALDDIAVLALSDLLQCPTLGEFDRDPFISGWRSASTGQTASLDSIPRQQAHVAVMRKKLAADPTYFKQVYRNAFKLAKLESQRSVPMENALEYWKMFFDGSKGGIQWNGKGTKWLDLWLEFYETKGKRPVNKDLWNMVFELVMKTQEPDGEDLGWWNEDGAWPMAVDDFVAFVKERRDRDAIASVGGESMDVS